MAAEALLESMNKAREDKAQDESQKKKKEMPVDVMKGTAAEKKDNESEALKERYEKLLARHGIPDKKEFDHKREQIFLMVGQQLSDRFIEKVVRFPSGTIDRLRMAAFVMGEEYSLERISDKTPDEEQIREWINDFVRETISPVTAVPPQASVERSLDIMGRHMVRQQEIAGAQINRLTEYLKYMSVMAQERSENDLAAMRSENQKERERAQKQIDLLSDENFRLSMKIEDVQEEERKREEAKNHRNATEKTPAWGEVQIPPVMID